MPTHPPSIATAKPRAAGFTSSGIGRIRSLGSFLPEFAEFKDLSRPPRKRVNAIIGWGLKATADRARRLAVRQKVPYIALEDGFLRSMGLGVRGYAPHSMVVDYQGIYYDARHPSDLETLIADGDFSAAELARARHCMALIRHHRLSKYNHAPDRALPISDRRRVLVVDQTQGDASITYGAANDDTFRDMLASAINETPDAEVLVKVHPDVIAGKKTGHLLEDARAQGCMLIADDLNPWALFDAVDSVHVVTSQLGFEALLAGKRVVCHGLPFFAGWGLTEDRQHCPRRGNPRSLEAVFAAAYLRYCRYANPYTGDISSLEETIDLIADQKRQRTRHSGDWWALGFSGWKRNFIGDFLGPNAKVHFSGKQVLFSPKQVRFSPKRFPRRLQESQGPRILMWAHQASEAHHRQCEQQGLSMWRMEDGFLRSVGLGADLVAPLSLVLDSQGIYYDASQPNDLEDILNDADFSPNLLERAARLRQRLIATRVSKYNLSGRPLPDLPSATRILLVPGQVESDASIACGSPDIQTNQALLLAVRAANPDAFIIYKPHPDVVSGARVGSIDANATSHHGLPLYDLEVTDADITDLLDVAHEVHTMCSLTGFEGLLRGVSVHTYGMPFYAGWGLTQDRLACSRRQRLLSLDALVAGTLILYPTYVTPREKQLCNAETALRLLEQQRAMHRGLSLATRIYRRYRSLMSGRR